MAGWHYQLNGHAFEQTLGNGEGQGSLACCSPWGHKQPDTTERLNNDNRGRRGSLETLVVARMETKQPFLLLLSGDVQGVSPVPNGAFPRGLSPLPHDLDETCPEHSDSGTISRDRCSHPQASHFGFAYWK